MLLIQTRCVILSALCPICAARLGSSKLGRIDDSVLQVSALLHPYKDPLSHLQTLSFVRMFTRMLKSALGYFVIHFSYIHSPVFLVFLFIWDERNSELWQHLSVHRVWS